MRLLMFSLLFAWCAPALGAQQPDEVLPQPLPAGPSAQLMPQGSYPPVFPVVPPRRPLPGTREVWQYMGVTETGRYRPRVVLSPYGSYYYYNGEPYPWITNRSQIYMPYALD